MKLTLLTLALCSTPALAAAPTSATVVLNNALDLNRFTALAASCGTAVPVDTLTAVASTESALYPYALSVNYPETAARNAGFGVGTLSLARQPRNRQEAGSWAGWFESHGYTVSMGLMQVNTQTARLYGYTPGDLLDPCINLRLGAAVLSRYYHAAHRPGLSPSQALLDALSSYNTGNKNAGYSNGYVDNILRHRPAPVLPYKDNSAIQNQPHHTGGSRHE